MTIITMAPDLVTWVSRRRREPDGAALFGATGVLFAPVEQERREALRAHLDAGMAPAEALYAVAPDATFVAADDLASLVLHAEERELVVRTVDGQELRWTFLDTESGPWLFDALRATYGDGEPFEFARPSFPAAGRRHLVSTAVMAALLGLFVWATHSDASRDIEVTSVRTSRRGANLRETFEWLYATFGLGGMVAIALLATLAVWAFQASKEQRKGAGTYTARFRRDAPIPTAEGELST